MTCFVYLFKKLSNRKADRKRAESAVPLNQSEIGTSFATEPLAKPKSLNPLWLAIPSFFDAVETSFKNIPLTLIAASVTQMLRSSVVLFTALLALAFLNRKLYRHHWTSLLMIIVGIGLVGLSSIVAGEDDK